MIELAKMLGWHVAHFGNTMKNVRRGDSYVSIPDKGAAGFPDLVLVRAPRLVFAELKTQKGKLSDKQLEWMGLLAQLNGGVESYIWRPRDWENGDIGRTLR